MNRIFVGFIIFLFGVMAGYGWQNYHHGLRITVIKREIAATRKLMESLENSLTLLKNELKHQKKLRSGAIQEENFEKWTDILSSDCNGGDLISCSCLAANLSPSGKFELCDVCRLAEDGFIAETK